MKSFLGTKVLVGAMSLLIVAVVVPALPLHAADTNTDASSQGAGKSGGSLAGSPNPDIWFRSFMGPEKVWDFFFSDKDVWGEEPVVIVLEGELPTSGQVTKGVAVGFFSGKRRDIFTKLNPPDAQGNYACVSYLYYSHFYADTQRKLARRLTPPQEACDLFKVKTEDGGDIELAYDTTLGWGGIVGGILPEKVTEQVRHDGKIFMTPQGSAKEHDVSHLLETGKIVYVPIGIDAAGCEPLRAHYVKRDRTGALVWAKTFAHFYADRNSAPDWELHFGQHDFTCAEKLRVYSTGGPILLLPDGTALLGGPDSIVRVKQVDGYSPAPPAPNMKILDTRDVLKAKLDLMKENTSLLKKCIESGVPFKGNKGCMVDDDNRERMQLDLVRLLFK